MSARVIYKIARMEFVRIMTNPIVLFTVALLMIIAFLNGAGGVDVLNYISSTDNTDTAVLKGFTQIFGSTGMILTIIAAFFSATSIPYDSWKGSLNLLLAKPLYRRDYIFGKFVGLAAFMLLFIMFIVLFTGLMVIVYFRGPQSISGYLWRVFAYITVLTLSCWLVIALNMLFGIVSKNVLFVTAAAITYFFIDWIWYSYRFFGVLSILTPQTLLCRFIYDANTSISLFDSLIPFNQWFSNAIPYFSLLIIELVILLLAGIFLFSREDSN